MIARLLAAFALAASTVCAQTVSGVVQSAECEYLPGADVVLRGDAARHHVVSGVGGVFSLDDAREPRYVIEAGLAGFYGYQGEVVTAASGSTSVRVALPTDEVALEQVVENGMAPLDRGTRRVRVQDYDCHPIAGATVTLAGRGSWSGTTDASGVVRLRGMPKGPYWITVSATGHTSATIQPVSLPFKYMEELVIPLRRGPPAPADAFVKWNPAMITPETQPRRIRVVAMGDSTTAGTPAFKSPREAPPDGSGDVKSQYAYWLMKPHPEWDVINQGVNAQRSDVIAARFDEDVLAKKPDVVVIIAGVNDVYQGRPAQHVKDQLAAMYQKARAARIRVVAGTIIPYNTATPDQNARMHDVNAWIRAQADAGIVTFVDTRAAVAARDNPDMLVSSPDGLHPDAAGYRRMADAIAPAILRALLGA